jgi:hypothetical protein
MAAIVLTASRVSCSSSLLDPINHTWQLHSVNGALLPDTVPNSSPVIVITSGTAVTNGQGTYTLSFTGTSDGSTGSVGSDQGSWTITSSTFFFRSSNGAVPDYIGALGTDSIRITLPGQIVHSSNQSIDMVFTLAP